MMLIIALLIIAGLFFFIVGTIGLIRLPDTYTRIHAPTKCDTLGLGLIILGLIIYNGFTIASTKLLFILIFLWFTSPTAASAISKAAMESEVEFLEGTFFYNQDQLDVVEDD